MAGRTVLVHGGAGAVGLCAVQLARRAGAVVIATVRSPDQEATGRNAGAHHVVIAGPKLVDQLRDLAPDGVHHIVDVAFGANVAANVEVLSVGGSIAAYATDGMTTAIPFWPLVFKNVRVCFLGSDDFPAGAKAAAARELNDALEAGWSGFNISERIPLSEIATAHELVEQHDRRGRVVVAV